MIWKGKEIKTIGDLTSAVGNLESEEEGAQFMALYRSENEHADKNVGYVSGYRDPETMRRIQKFTQTEHPIFGKETPTPENAIRAGMLMGKRARSL